MYSLHNEITIQTKFNKWVFGGLKRILMLKSYLHKLDELTFSMVVLTNGISENVQKILAEVDLLTYFLAIIDTRGSMIIESHKKINCKYFNSSNRCLINGIYNKELFIKNYLMNCNTCIWKNTDIINNLHILLFNSVNI